MSPDVTRVVALGLAFACCEVILGGCLVRGIVSRSLWRLTLSAFGVFTLVSVYRFLTGESTCGCFGRLSVPPLWTAILDMAMCFALCAVPVSTQLGIADQRRRFTSAIVWSLAAAFLTGMATAVGVVRADGETAKQVFLNPSSWIGQLFPLVDEIEGGTELAVDDWLVVLYHHDCPKCQQVIETLVAGGNNTGVNVILVELPPFGDAEAVQGFRHARLDGERRWFCETPVELVLHLGVVKAVNYPSD